MTKLYLVLPCYNESKSIETLAARAIGGAQKRRLSPNEFELVLVNNGSTDDSKEAFQRVKQTHGAFVKIVTVEKNQGYGHGIFQGLKAAGRGIVAWSHADEQCDPEDVFTAWERLLATSDEMLLIKGKRISRPLGNWLFSRCFELTTFFLLGRWIYEVNAQPKVFYSNLMSVLPNPPKDFAFDLYVLLQAKKSGWRFETTSVYFRPRSHGQSKWASTFRSRVRTIRAMVNFLFQYRRGTFSVTPGDAHEVRRAS